MSTIRQVTAYVGECIGEHLRPDALGVKRIDDNTLRLVTRKAGTEFERGAVFIITVTKEEES